MSKTEYEKKLKELRELEELQRLQFGLPHLFGFKAYPWQGRVWESDNKEIFVCSANQVGKSTIAIRKNIRLATDPSLWPRFWPNLPAGRAPNLFWYFYPTMPVAQIEFETKWEPLLLPQREFKNHPQFGWEPEYDKGFIQKIRFNTGVQIQFKSYSMKVKDLQTATVYHVTADEEMPVEYLPEVKARLNSSEGLFLMVFTATLGQLHWLMTMEPPTKQDEKHPDALKIQASLYDSQYYEDGTPSPWTDKKIEAAKQNCPTEAEIQRRVMGRFVRSHGLRLESFSLERNMSDPHPLPSSWIYYGGVDPGSGGQSGHPAALVIIAVSPDYKQGRIYKAWRGDGIPTAASDILEEYRKLKGRLPMAAQVYDWAAKDFFTVASRVGESFIPAQKGRDDGFGLLNTLFKNSMLKLQRGDPEIDKLVHEICTLPVEIDKKKASDDLIDAMRYAAMAVPWDFSDVEDSLRIEDEVAEERKPKVELTPAQERRQWYMSGPAPSDDIADEFDFWNHLSGVSEGE